MGRVDRKVALITGAGRGQGRSHALRLATEGADIIAVDICRDIRSVPYALASAADLQETADIVRGLGRRVYAAQADVRDGVALAGAVRAGVEQLGRLDIVCANAGIGTFIPIDQMRDEHWQDIIGVNLTGAWHTVKVSLPFLRSGGRGGSIILVSSTAGIRGFANCSHYSAAKHGLVGLMKALANELGRAMIRVNTVHPTSVSTPMIHNRSSYRLFRPDLEDPGPEDVATPFAGLNILPVPWVEASDVSNAVLWLASDEARYVTGMQFTIDAGCAERTGSPQPES
jgi:(+)-trans-carveol dehydrogenase